MKKLIKEALSKWYILKVSIRDDPTSFDKIWAFKIYPITICVDRYILDSLASPNIYQSGVPAEDVENTITNWLNKQKKIIIQENIRNRIEKYFEYWEYVHGTEFISN